MDNADEKKVDHREGLLTLSQLEESWMQSQLSLSGLIQQHMTRLSRPGHFLQVHIIHPSRTYCCALAHTSWVPLVALDSHHSGGIHNPPPRPVIR